MIAPSIDRYLNQHGSSSKLRQKADRRNTHKNKVQEYFLEVAIRTKPDMMEAFARQAGAILPKVEIPGLRLFAAGICLDPDPRKVIHLWKLDSADILRDAMIRLSDVPAYTVLDQMVVDEVQDICTPLLEYQTSARPDANLYVRITGEVATVELAEFVARIEAGAGRFEKNSGWKIAGALINVTGRVNRVSLIWASPSRAKAVEFITDMPGYDLILDPETELWAPAPYNPTTNDLKRVIKTPRRL